MLICELRRDSSSVSLASFPGITNNKDLLALLNQHKPSRVVLFRAGLVINKDVISQGIPLLNIHCAKVPEYGGLGSIDRALKDNALNRMQHFIKSQRQLIQVKCLILNHLNSMHLNHIAKTKKLLIKRASSFFIDQPKNNRLLWI